MSDRFLEELKDATDLVSLVGRYTNVKKAGKNYSAKSPFRAERTPSFSVSPDRGLWYDFGASEGGDAIRFLEKVENISFHEAVEMLAQINNVPVPDSWGANSKEKQEDKKDLHGLHWAAAEYFTQQLAQHPVAQAYLRDRGIDEVTQKQWHIGYGGDAKDGLTRYLVSKGFKAKDIAGSGVAYTREFGGGGMQDRFWGRIITPVHEPRNGDIIAFSARVLPGFDAKAKYINSPENPVYTKSKTLFGLHKARKSILKKDLCVIAEGNFDVISTHKAGADWVVATCGTALTDDHIRMLRRMTRRIALAFDTDKAGKRATLRAAELLLKAGLTPYVVTGIAGKDLDDLAQADPHGAKKVLDTCQNALEFFAGAFAEKLLKEGGIESEKQYLRSLFGFLILSQSALEIDAILDLAATHTKRPKHVIEKEFRQYQVGATGPKQKYIAPTQNSMPDGEQQIVGLLRAYWNVCAPLAPIVGPLLQNEATRAMLTKIEHNTLALEDMITLTSWELTAPEIMPAEAKASVESWVARQQAGNARHAQTRAALAQFEQGQA